MLPRRRPLAQERLALVGVWPPYFPTPLTRRPLETRLGVAESGLPTVYFE